MPLLQLEIEGQRRAHHGFTGQLTQDEIGGLLPHPLIGDADRGEGRIAGPRHVQIVETGDGELARHVQVAALAFEQHPGRQLVIDADQRIQFGPAQQELPQHGRPRAEAGSLRGVDDGVGER